MDTRELRLKKIDDVLELTDSIINKKYLSFLTNEQTYKLRSLTMNELAVSIERHARIYHLRKFVYDSNENFLNKLITVVNVACALKGTILTSIQGHGEVVDFYIGIVAKEGKGAAGLQNREALLNAFADTISGNFIGSDLGERIEGKELKRFSDGIGGRAVCSVSVVPSMRKGDKTDIGTYVQGIENLVDSLKGRKYTLLTIADPVAPESLMEIRRGYESIYNHLVPLYKVAKTRGTSDTVSLSEIDTANYVKGITEGITRTQGKSVSAGFSNGFQMGITASIFAGVGLGASAGVNHSQSHGTSVTDSLSSGCHMSEQQGQGYSRTAGAGRTTSNSTQVSVENRMIKSMLDRIEKHIGRIDECEGYGAFHSATYILADDKATALNVSGNFVSLMKGERSSVQVWAVNCWEQSGSGQVDGEMEVFQGILNSLRHLTHPRFQVNEQVSVSPCAMVSGPELAVQLGFPKKSIGGLIVVPMHPFGRNVAETEGETMELGSLYFMGRKEARKVNLDVDSLSAHTFITGSTGAGKSNAIYGMLEKLMQRNIPFMVVEPAKGEYRNVLGQLEDVAVWGTNEKNTELLRINPFSFHEDIHVLEHIDRIIEIFNVCWPMYAAMPAVLKEALEEAYICCGWDLDTSKNRYGDRVFPAFLDLRNALETVIEGSAYDQEVKSNYKGSLLTRTGTLSNGLNGKIFSAEEISGEELFDKNVVIDLSRVGSAETKSLIMGILVMKLQEYRMCQGGGNRRLKHVTVLEEAHHLLRQSRGGQNPESSGIAGKSVEMIANAIAEMRTCGEGFIIADQAPGLLDLSVIRNTNTKIIMRTPEYHDRLLAGRAAGLNEGQIEELAKLPLGVAAVYQNNWLEPVLCRFHKYRYDEQFIYRKKRTEVFENIRNTRTELVKWLIGSRIQEGAETEKWKPDMGLIRRKMERLPLSAESRLLIIKNLKIQEQDSQINPWKEFRFDRLAGLVTEVLGCQKEIRHICSRADSPDELQIVLEELWGGRMEGTVPKIAGLEISHCLMKVYSKAGDREKKQYYDWDHMIRSKYIGT